MQMTEVMTLLKSATGHALVKSFSGTDLTQQPFSTGKLFNVSEEPVSDLKSLSALLQRLENDPTHTIIRGSLVDGQNSPVTRNKNTFTAIPRQWCMIDIDSLAWDGDVSDQQEMVSYAIQQLPPEFQSADCWYHFSSSMGIKSGINVYQWFGCFDVFLSPISSPKNHLMLPLAPARKSVSYCGRTRLARARVRLAYLC
jgi:hypothetical protein